MNMLPWSFYFWQYVLSVHRANGLLSVMESEGAQKIFSTAIVFHKLRRQFHEVPPYIGSDKLSNVYWRTSHVVNLPNSCRNVSTSPSVNSAGFPSVGFVRFITTLTCGRTLFLCGQSTDLDILSSMRHLAFLCGMEIGIEYSQIRSVFIEHFISFYILMIDRMSLFSLNVMPYSLLASPNTPSMTFDSSK